MTPRKKRSKMEPTDSRRKYTKEPDPAVPKETHPCSECGRRFLSRKALCGHMRCHPERGWRGTNPPPTAEDHEIAASLLRLSSGPHFSETTMDTDSMLATELAGHSNDRFECSNCKRVFGSRQALGGHRASHRNVKGCFAITWNDAREEDEQNQKGTEEKKNKCEVSLSSSSGLTGTD